MNIWLQIAENSFQWNCRRKSMEVRQQTQEHGLYEIFLKIGDKRNLRICLTSKSCIGILHCFCTVQRFPLCKRDLHSELPWKLEMVSIPVAEEDLSLDWYNRREHLSPWRHSRGVKFSSPLGEDFLTFQNKDKVCLSSLSGGSLSCNIPCCTHS